MLFCKVKVETIKVIDARKLHCMSLYLCNVLLFMSLMLWNLTIGMVPALQFLLSCI